MTQLTAGPPATLAQWVRVVGNLVNLSTPLGLAFAAIGRARIRRGPRGLLLAEGYRSRFPSAGAFTIGDVLITGRDWPVILKRFPGLLEHEERHSWQYLACLGLPFLPTYAICTAWSWLRTGDRASRNIFERHAGLIAGGYSELPTRPWSAGVVALVNLIGSGLAARRSAASQR